MKEKFLDECKQIQQNCTYTAETHHQIAIFNRNLVYGFQIIPASIAAVTSTLVVANEQPDSWLWITAASAVINVIATVFDPNKQYQAHINLAKKFTVLKHDARFLQESKYYKLSDEDFAVAVEKLHDRYNDLVLDAPPTDGWAFKIARQVIKAGTHDPDKDEKGNIK